MSEEYVTTDLLRDDVDLKLNIEALEIETESFDTILCGHVLEHVDDRRALKEMFRVLRPGGTAILAVPLVEGWARTYEDPVISTERGRLLNFGQADHVRVFGRDFRDRVRGCRFRARRVRRRWPRPRARHGLPAGGKIFLARRPPR